MKLSLRLKTVQTAAIGEGFQHPMHLPFWATNVEPWLSDGSGIHQEVSCADSADVFACVFTSINESMTERR